MKPEFSKFTFWSVVATGVVCVLVLATLTFQSLFRLFGTQPENERATPVATDNACSASSEASGQGDASERASPGQDVKSIADIGEHPSVNPVPVNNEFCTDSEMIRQQERERQERIEDLRSAGKNSDSNAVPPEQQLKQEGIEASLL
jgi:hypothetical protein